VGAIEEFKRARLMHAARRNEDCFAKEINELQEGESGPRGNSNRRASAKRVRRIASYLIPRVHFIGVSTNTLLASCGLTRPMKKVSCLIPRVHFIAVSTNDLLVYCRLAPPLTLTAGHTVTRILCYSLTA
jgi:hypothetical protein